MSKAKSNGAPKKKSKSKPRNPERVGERKIGERVETIQQKLSPMEVEDVRRNVCEMLASLDKLEEERKTATAAIRSKIQELKSKIRIETGVASSARRDVEVTIEEWLNEKNEVKRVRTDTGEVIGARNARIDELQEEMFDDEDDDSDDDSPKAETAGDFGEGTAS
jgi:hypothetical protein